jgi:hypothetical protein
VARTAPSGGEVEYQSSPRATESAFDFFATAASTTKTFTVCFCPTESSAAPKYWALLKVTSSPVRVRLQIG